MLQAPAIPPKPTPPKCVVYPSLFQKEIASILRDSTDFDVIFRQGKFSAPAHRLFLSAASPLFYRIFVCESTRLPQMQIRLPNPIQFRDPIRRPVRISGPSEGRSNSGVPLEGRFASRIPSEGRSSCRIPSEGRSNSGIPSEGRSSCRIRSKSPQAAKDPAFIKSPTADTVFFLEPNAADRGNSPEPPSATFPAFCSTISANANFCYAKLKKSKKNLKSIKGSHSAYGCLENSEKFDPEKSLVAQNSTHPRPQIQESHVAQNSAHPRPQVPGSQVPGSQVPGFQIPGSQVPGFQIPGSLVAKNSAHPRSQIPDSIEPPKFMKYFRLEENKKISRWIFEISEKIPWDSIRLILHFIYTGEFMMTAETDLDLLKEIAAEFELTILSEKIANADLDLNDYQEKFHKRLFELSVDCGLFNGIHTLSINFNFSLSIADFLMVYIP